MRKDKILIPKEELYDLYIKQNLKMEEVAEKFKVSKGTIIRRVKEYNLYKPKELVVEKSRSYKHITKEVLEELYYTKGKSLVEIAQELNVSLNTISNKIDRLGIKRRGAFFNIDNIKDKKFNKLTVIALSDQSLKNGTRIWKCECECGNIKFVPTHKLKSGGIKSCGKCGRRKRNPEDYSHEEITIGFWNSIKYNATRRKLDFDITMEYVWNLFISQERKCALTKIELKMPSTIYKDRVATNNCASLDRIDSSKGYVEGNVQWVHKWINIMKQDFTQEEFIYFCKKVSENN